MFVITRNIVIILASLFVVGQFIPEHIYEKLNFDLWLLLIKANLFAEQNISLAINFSEQESLIYELAGYYIEMLLNLDISSQRRFRKIWSLSTFLHNHQLVIDLLNIVECNKAGVDQYEGEKFFKLYLQCAESLIENGNAWM
ncbi:30097_t:CDS:1, partial [Gigaspora margarita]